MLFYSSGQHIKEFTDFLSKHTDTFQVIDECVILVGCEDLQDVPLSERLHLPQPTIDTAGIQQLLDFFAQCIEIKGKIYGIFVKKETFTIPFSFQVPSLSINYFIW